MACLNVYFYVVVGLLLVAGSTDGKPSIFEKLFCSLTELLANTECCRSARVDFRYSEFRDVLRRRLYGQPMAADWLARAVRDHWDSGRKPRKALVLTLHGPTGTGKTYITRILADYTFALGSKSQFYHFFSAMVHFPDKAKHDIYSNQLRSWLLGNASYCEKSLFVFDEIDKMPPPVLDSLKPFVDYNSVINGVDFSRSIFIFLSNIGDHMLMRDMVAWKRQGRDRNDFRIEKQDRQLSEYAFSSHESSLKDSELLRHHLISHFIPFLPLEREQVTQCVVDYLKDIGKAHFAGKASFIQDVLNEVAFVPKTEKFFASTGCKRVESKVNTVLEALLWNRSDEGSDDGDYGVVKADRSGRQNDDRFDL